MALSKYLLSNYSSPASVLGMSEEGLFMDDIFSLTNGGSSTRIDAVISDATADGDSAVVTEVTNLKNAALAIAGGISGSSFLTKGTKTIFCIDNGDFATGQDAVDAAAAGDTILFGVKSGGWGDLVIPEGKNLSLKGLQAARGILVQVGSITFDVNSGTAVNNQLYIDSLRIGSSSDTCLKFLGTAPARLRVSNSYIYAGTTNRCVEFYNSGAGSSAYIYDSVIGSNSSSAIGIESSTTYFKLYRSTVDNSSYLLKVTGGLTEVDSAVFSLDSLNEIVQVTAGALICGRSAFINNTTNGSGVSVATGAVFSDGMNTYAVKTGTGYCVKGTGIHLYALPSFADSAAASGNVKMQSTLTNLPFTVSFTSAP